MLLLSNPLHTRVGHASFLAELLIEVMIWGESDWCKSTLHHVSIEHVHEGDHPHVGPRFLVVCDFAETVLLAGTHGSSELIHVHLEVTQADAGINEQDCVEFFVDSCFFEPACDFPGHLFLAHVDFFKQMSASGQEKLSFLMENFGKGLMLADMSSLILVLCHFLLGSSFTTFFLLDFFVLIGIRLAFLHVKNCQCKHLQATGFLWFIEWGAISVGQAEHGLGWTGFCPHDSKTSRAVVRLGISAECCPIGKCTDIDQTGSAGWVSHGVETKQGK